jgi:Protein of unknown function (DUF1571)
MTTQRRNFLTALLGSGFTIAASTQLFPRIALGDEPTLTEPVHRVASAAVASSASLARPLDTAMQIANDGLTQCRAQVNDYTATLVKRERVDGVLGEHDFIFVKVRNRKIVNGQLVQPLSVYLTYLKPAAVKGREVIYVEGQNDGNMIAHEGGFKGRFLPTMPLPPNGMLAMRGQRYPITEIGIENLMVKLIERGETARRYPDVTCNFRKNAKVKDRVCTVLEVTQPNRHPELDFYQAQVFIDDTYNLPIRYIAFDWPTQQGEPLVVIEEYNYLDLKVNVGLVDADFDPKNPQYNFYSK